MICTRGASATPRCRHGLDGGGIGADAERRIHTFNTRTTTVTSLGVSRRLVTSDALETSWVICRQPPFPNGLVIQLI